jgi:hypothetical protein
MRARRGPLPEYSLPMIEDASQDDDGPWDGVDEDGKVWTPVEGTGTYLRWAREVHEGIPLLHVWLLGGVSRHRQETSTLADALDRIPSDAQLDTDVVVLDARRFSNADGDECQHVTGVFPGLPCCWIVREHLGQTERGDRWDIPPLRWLTLNEADAIARVVALRKAGRFFETEQGLFVDEPPHPVVIGTWTARGFEQTHGRSRRLYHRNRLVEAQFDDHDPPTRVLWPTPDATGIAHEAERRGARLVYVGERLVEVDLRPYMTKRTASENWLDALDGIEGIEQLELGEVPTSDAQLIEVLRRWPTLRELDLGSGAIGQSVIEALLTGAGPALETLCATTTPSAASRLAETRPTLRLRSR